MNGRKEFIKVDPKSFNGVKSNYKPNESNGVHIKSEDEIKNDLYITEMGFSLVIEAIIASKKPLIGHNCMYDLVYMYN